MLTKIKQNYLLVGFTSSFWAERLIAIFNFIIVLQLTRSSLSVLKY